MADDRERPFEERAYANYRSEMKDVGNAAALVEKRDGITDYRQPLGVEETRELTILLSFGGPSEGYRIVFDPYNRVIGGYYFFANWLEHRDFKLTDDELKRVLTVYPVCPRC